MLVIKHYNILQNIIFLCVHQKKETHTALEQVEGEQMMTEFSFLGEVNFTLLHLKTYNLINKYNVNFSRFQNKHPFFNPYIVFFLFDV